MILTINVTVINTVAKLLFRDVTPLICNSPIWVLKTTMTST